MSQGLFLLSLFQHIRHASVLSIDLFVCMGIRIHCLLHKSIAFVSHNIYSLCKKISAQVYRDMSCDVWYISKLTDERGFFQNAVDAWLESLLCHYLLQMCTGRFRLCLTCFCGRYRPYCWTPARTLTDEPRK